MALATAARLPLGRGVACATLPNSRDDWVVPYRQGKLGTPIASQQQVPQEAWGAPRRRRRRWASCDGHRLVSPEMRDSPGCNVNGWLTDSRHSKGVTPMPLRREMT